MTGSDRENGKNGNARKIARCPHTNLTLPECSCQPCLRALVQQHAPHLAPPAVVPLTRADVRVMVREPGDDVRYGVR